MVPTKNLNNEWLNTQKSNRTWTKATALTFNTSKSSTRMVLEGTDLYSSAETGDPPFRLKSLLQVGCDEKLNIKHHLQCPRWKQTLYWKLFHNPNPLQMPVQPTPFHSSNLNTNFHHFQKYINMTSMPLLSYDEYKLYHNCQRIITKSILTWLACHFYHMMNTSSITTATGSLPNRLYTYHSQLERRNYYQHKLK